MQQLVSLLEQYGLSFVFLHVLIEQAGVPLPAYPTLIRHVEVVAAPAVLPPVAHGADFGRGIACSARPGVSEDAKASAKRKPPKAALTALVSEAGSFQGSNIKSSRKLFIVKLQVRIAVSVYVTQASRAYWRQA